MDDYLGPITLTTGCFLAGIGLLFFISGLGLPGFLFSAFGALTILFASFVD